MIQRTEQIKIGKTHQFYPMLDGFCFASKNLYNQALYRVRQNFCAGNGYLNYNKIDASFKADNGLNNADYRAMPTAASAQQTLMLMHNNWSSFFEATKHYKATPELFTGRPRIPKYLDKTKGRQNVVLPGQSLVVSDGIIRFPKVFCGFTLRFRHADVTVRQVRFVPHGSFITAEIVYATVDHELLPNNGRYMGIDLGVSNFATVVSNVMSPVIINGGILKSANQLYNKQNAHYRTIETAFNPIVDHNGASHCKQTNRLQLITAKRNARVKDGMHKVSRFIVGLAVEHKVTKIIVGKNDGWKQKANLGRRTNQNFVQLPHSRFISMLTYKANTEGIEVIAHEESYTSKTSHLDGEQPFKHGIYMGKRIKRGLFRTSNGTIVNADVNGAAQIMRKVFPIAYAYGIEGGVNPVKVVVA